MTGLQEKLFGTRAAGLYILLFAAAIGIATFIENDFGTSAAQKLVFRTRWFEILLLLFSMSIVHNVIKFRFIPQKKWAVLTFHLSVLVILLGAGVTRYIGYEGMMHIREDATSNLFISAEPYLLFEAKKDGKSYRFNEPVAFASLGRNRFRESYQIGGEDVKIELVRFIPNPEQVLETADDGVATLKLVVAGPRGREEYFLREGEVRNFNGTLFNFGNPEQPGAINIYYRDNNLTFNTPTWLTQMQMATQQTDTIYPGQYQMMLVRSLYSNPSINFVVGDFNPRGKLMLKSTDRKMKAESMAAVALKVTSGSESGEVVVTGNKGMQGEPQTVRVGNIELTAAYGSKTLQLPFAIKLRDFIMERYPGTNSASSYASEVTLIDKRNNHTEDYRIYMNHILDYDGYRFFQSSFDQDELGTVLSVNHDFWGTWISYIGYALLTLGMIFTFFSPNTRFAELSRRLRQMRQQAGTATAAGLVLLAMAIPQAGWADNVDERPVHVIAKPHATEFGRLVVQDHRGRMKPMNTMSSEVVRKVAHKESMFGLSADQIFLGMMLYPQEWAAMPIIHLGRNEAVRATLGVSGDKASFNDFFDAGGSYKLKDAVRRAFSLEPIDQSQFDKDVIKVDERVNICNMVFNGAMARLYPVAGDPNNHWMTFADALQPSHEGMPIPPFAVRFLPEYASAVQEGVAGNGWADADQKLEALHQFQQANGGELLLSQRKVDMEIMLNNMNVFSRLSRYYGLLGLVFLALFFTQIFRPGSNLKWPIRIAFGALVAMFLFHTAGLAIRWYVSGRAPWSNGYESLIYIGFTTVLAGIIFSRKSTGGLTATSILASTILMVAGMSWLDPEITPLVPVLKSYWLTIHVSLIAGSYGFLMLGAIIGLLNMLSMIFLTQNNQERVFRTVKELTYVSEMTLIGGLFMISIGTYLGGIWANESWGRYWGWDAKETWALVTILVYAFILHMRLIPGMRGLYPFNLASLFGFASVMMTYFGVNYYLSGLHSYAAGDPVPIPPSVYITAAVFTTISILGYLKYRKFDAPRYT